MPPHSKNAEKGTLTRPVQSAPYAFFELPRVVGTALVVAGVVAEGSNPVPLVTSAGQEKPLARAHGAPAARVGTGRGRRLARVPAMVAGAHETLACLHGSVAAPASSLTPREAFLLVVGGGVIVLARRPVHVALGEGLGRRRAAAAALTSPWHVLRGL